MMKRAWALAVTLFPLMSAPAGIPPGRHAAGAEKFLFYLHGKIIEDQGIPRPRSGKYGFYEYEKILQAFRKRGFSVRSEMRPANTEVLTYAKKIAGQVEKLLQSGVAPDHITVVGASKGGMIAVFTSALLQNRNINFVFLSCCYEALLQKLRDMGTRVAGNILSIYDASDDTGCGSCQGFFAPARGKTLGRTREIVLHLGVGHGILYRPLPEWMEPVVAWADSKGAAMDKKDKGREADLAAIEKLHRTDMAAARIHDIQTLISLWTNDGILFLSGREPIRGKAAIWKYLQDQLPESQKYEITEYLHRFEEVRVIGDWAYEWATFTGTYHLKGGGPDLHERARLFRILHRQGDGSWKCHRAFAQDLPDHQG
jgi:uncharacterized protein (TIGR02246 family)